VERDLSLMLAYHTAIASVVIGFMPLILLCMAVVLGPRGRFLGGLWEQSFEVILGYVGLVGQLTRNDEHIDFSLDTTMFLKAPGGPRWLYIASNWSQDGPKMVQTCEAIFKIAFR
jgi:hypothetical protein